MRCDLKQIVQRCCCQIQDQYCRWKKNDEKIAIDNIWKMTILLIFWNQIWTLIVTKALGKIWCETIFFIFRPPFWNGSTDWNYFFFGFGFLLLYQWFRVPVKEPNGKVISRANKIMGPRGPPLLYTNGRTQDLIHLTVNQLLHSMF